jgi:hypothetical protein
MMGEAFLSRLFSSHASMQSQIEAQNVFEKTTNLDSTQDVALRMRNLCELASISTRSLKHVTNVCQNRDSCQVVICGYQTTPFFALHCSRAGLCVFCYNWTLYHLIALLVDYDIVREYSAKTSMVTSNTLGYDLQVAMAEAKRAIDVNMKSFTLRDLDLTLVDQLNFLVDPSFQQLDVLNILLPPLRSPFSFKKKIMLKADEAKKKKADEAVNLFESKKKKKKKMLCR